MSIEFVDGNHQVSGCTCTAECEWPCWQQIGSNLSNPTNGENA